MKITLEGRLLVAALVVALIWAFTPHTPLPATWIEPGTSSTRHGAFEKSEGIRR